MSWRSQIFLKLSLLLGGAAAGVVLLAVSFEIYARVDAWRHPGRSFESLEDLRASMLQAGAPAGGAVDLRDIVYPHPDDHIIYDLRPNLDVVFQKVPVRTNSCGMRGREVSLVKPPQVFRIALLGDSFAFGWGVREEESFAQVLERTLNRFAAGKRTFEVLNFGVPGYSTFQEVYKFLESGADFQPDAVLVYFVSNDFGYPFMVRDMARPGRLLSALEFARLTWQAIDPDVARQKMFLQGLDPNTALKKLSDYTRSEGIRLAVAVNPYQKWRQEKWRVPIFKERPDVTLIQLGKPLQQVIDARKLAPAALTLSADPHPSALKHEILGQVLASYYLDAIRP